MKKLFTLIALGSVVLVSADQYNQYVFQQQSPSQSKENRDAYSDSQLERSEKKYPRDTASSPQDRQLNAKIRDQLSNGWLSNIYKTIVIKSTNGAVVISGTVGNPENIQKISEQIEKIDGVKSVDNHLTVRNK